MQPILFSDVILRTIIYKKKNVFLLLIVYFSCFYSAVPRHYFIFSCVIYRIYISQRVTILKPSCIIVIVNKFVIGIFCVA